MDNYYILLLNNRPYGIGDLPYMLELLEDYICIHRMYGKEFVDFRIEKFEKYYRNNVIEIKEI